MKLEGEGTDDKMNKDFRFRQAFSLLSPGKQPTSGGVGEGSNKNGSRRGGGRLDLEILLLKGDEKRLDIFFLTFGRIGFPSR